jgi:LPS-assembly lipoprotein
MSSSDKARSGRFSILAGAAVLCAVALASGCTVGPLYGNAYAPTSTVAKVESIAIAPVSTRQAQEVRNQLIFMFSGGKGSPANPSYNMDLVVSSYSSAAAVIQSGTTEQSPTSSLLNMIAIYAVRDNATGQVVARGKRQVASAYDVHAPPAARYRP